MYKINRTGKWYTPERMAHRNTKAELDVEKGTNFGELSVDLGTATEEIQASLDAGAPTQGWLLMMYEAALLFVKQKMPYGWNEIRLDPMDFVNEFVTKEVYTYEDYSVGMPRSTGAIMMKLKLNFQKRSKIFTEQQSRIAFGYSFEDIKANRNLTIAEIEAKIEGDTMNRVSAPGWPLLNSNCNPLGANIGGLDPEMYSAYSV